jgi:hypothetical protein
MHDPLLFLGATDNNVQNFRRLGVLSEHKTRETATHGKLLLLLLLLLLVVLLLVVLLLLLLLLLLVLLQLKPQQQ